jgi:hypothetical protein
MALVIMSILASAIEQDLDPMSRSTSLNAILIGQTIITLILGTCTIYNSHSGYTAV